MGDVLYCVTQDPWVKCTSRPFSQFPRRSDPCSLWKPRLNAPQQGMEADRALHRMLSDVGGSAGRITPVCTAMTQGKSLLRLSARLCGVSAYTESVVEKVAAFQLGNSCMIACHAPRKRFSSPACVLIPQGNETKSGKRMNLRFCMNKMETQTCDY